MATAAGSAAGAVPSADALHGKQLSSQQSSSALRYATFDNEAFSLYSSNSPSRAKRALEAHLKDTDRRIQDASRLGTTLLHQRKELSARLKEVEEVESDTEVPEDLRQKLTELEKEYNEVGKETARAFLPKARVPSDGAEQSVLSASGRESPTKLTAPSSRKQRNVPTNRIHDIEFAAEISTSLLAQVRQLQAALLEKDDSLRESNSGKAQLETELYNLAQKLKRLDENEQRFKDENWTLETRLQELEAGLKESTDHETRLSTGLKTAQSEKQQAQRELDTLKATHEKLNDDHSVSKKQQETDLYGLRRDISLHQTENQSLHRKIQELTTQNTELAKAVSYRISQPSGASDREFVTADEDAQDEETGNDHYDPMSPVKGTPRHGMLESETLKSSLNHAHRMIQNLKSNIHREKTEKIELKRMLQDARDELETRRGDGSATSASLAKRRRGEVEALKFKKPVRPDRLGAARGASTTEYIESDPDWEDHDGQRTPSKSTFAAVGTSRRDDTESTDAFETANERNTTTENDSFETGTEGLAGNDSDELTETEGSVQRANLSRKLDRASLANARPGERYSYLSTASTSDEETEDDLSTTPQNDAAKYRQRMSRIARRSPRDVDGLDSPSAFNPQSPISSVGTPRPVGQTLGDELDALDDESYQGTPSQVSDITNGTPNTLRQASLEPVTPSRAPLHPPRSADFLDISNPLTHTQVLVKPPMTDAGMMTEPWKPQQESVEEKPSLVSRAGGIVGGVLAGVGLDRLGQSVVSSTKQPEDADEPVSAPTDSDLPLQAAAEEAPVPVVFSHSDILSQHTEPVAPAPVGEVPTNEHRNTAFIVPTSEEPKADVEAKSEPPVTFTHADVVSQETIPIARVDSPREPLPEAAVVSSSHPDPSFSSAADLSFSSIEYQDFAPTREEEPQFRSEKRNGVYYETPLSAAAIYANQQETTSDFAQNTSEAATVPVAEDPKDLIPNDRSAPAVGGMTHDVDAGVQDTVEANRSRSPVTNTGAIAAGAVAGYATSRFSENFSNAEPLLANGSARANVAPGNETQATIGVASSTTGDLAVENPAPKQVRGQTLNSSSNVMGPPLMPASAYKNPRPRTPADRTGERGVRDGATSRIIKGRDVRSGPQQSPSNVSRRTSMSSFVSEIDDRFNMRRGQLMYGADSESVTDPRMIQAITQTMIGEYLWKYTRKAGRSETSNTRHRRFFWVHPYTRTLYWSEQDPSTAGRSMLKAKSVAIEAVRVITDDNAYPPGLHRKSIVIVTPGREIVFTAPTGQRHETWFNALSYLLLRTEEEKAEMDNAVKAAEAEEPSSGFSIRRSLSRATGRDQSQSRQSLSSYNSRTTRASSLGRGGGRAAAHRPSGLQQSYSPASSPKIGGPSSQGSDTQGDAAGGRFSSLTGRFRSSSNRRGRSSISKSRNVGLADPADIYDASVVNESAEDLRAVIERQEMDADRLENVRACCDGKHDVGSLKHRSARHSSFGRLGGGSHDHSQHLQPPSDSVRSRT